MTTAEPGVGSSGLVSRAKNIILSPRAEWDRIDGEPATIKGLYLNYVCILAAIPAICMAIGRLMPMGGFGLYIHYSPVAAIGWGVLYYIGQLVGVFVTAMVIDALAPSFGGQKNQIQALKVVAYANTAAWLAGVFQILPMLAVLSIVGLYSLYLLYLGIPRLMKAPQEKALGYTIVAIIVAAVVYAVIFWVMMLFSGMFLLGTVATVAGGY
jgi:hypothetical protein